MGEAGGGNIPASGGRQPIGALSTRGLFLLAADFTDGDMANVRARAEPAGLALPVACRCATTGCIRTVAT